MIFPLSVALIEMEAWNLQSASFKYVSLSKLASIEREMVYPSTVCVTSVEKFIIKLN